MSFKTYLSESKDDKYAISNLNLTRLDIEAVMSAMRNDGKKFSNAEELAYLCSGFQKYSREHKAFSYHVALADLSKDDDVDTFIVHEVYIEVNENGKIIGYIYKEKIEEGLTEKQAKDACK
jgi:hypothetical protein